MNSQFMEMMKDNLRPRWTPAPRRFRPVGSTSRETALCRGAASLKTHISMRVYARLKSEPPLMPAANIRPLRKPIGSLRRFFDTDRQKNSWRRSFRGAPIVRLMKQETVSFLAGNQRPGVSALWALPAEGPPYAKGRPS
jgi:hypothetical protein